MASHRACDKIIQEIREYLKNISGTLCDETHEYVDEINPERKKIVNNKTSIWIRLYV